MSSDTESCQYGESRAQLCYDFASWDYVVFGMLFVVSASIGVFFAYRSRNKTEDEDDYLLGGRSLSAIPVSLSLTSSFMSAITVLGTPAEFYIYGTMFWWYAISYTMVGIIVSQIYIPIFYRLGITSTYEYLEKRFSRPVRILATTVFIVNTVLYVGICIYAPALALNEVTGLGVWWSVALTAVVCTFYTTLGGLKAVVWTDVFQCMVMWIGFIAILIRGSIVMGGFGNIWNIASEGGRIEYNKFSFDPTIRHTFWTITIGGTFLWTGTYGTTQSMVQRYISCKSEKHAQVAVLLNVIGLYIILILTGLSGLTMYAYYASCDPYSKEWVGATDQLMPYFVLELLHDYPGLPGIYVCSAFSGTLSTVSTGINAMSTVTTEDYIKPLKSLSPRTTIILSKIFVVIYGAICMAMAVLASQLGGVLQAALSINGIVGGPMVGLFTLGMILPWSNSIGAFVGVICGLGFSSWVYVGSTIYPPSAEKRGVLPLCTNMCNTTADMSCGFNETMEKTTLPPFTTTVGPTVEPPPIAAFYSLSYAYYPVLGFCVTIVIGLLTSFLTGYQHPSKLPPGTVYRFFDHPVFMWLPKKVRRWLWCGVRHGENNDDKDYIGDMSYGFETIRDTKQDEGNSYRYKGDNVDFIPGGEKNGNEYENKTNGYSGPEYGYSNKAFQLPNEGPNITSTAL
uniref:sodium-coupled monocarboxylate transporter 1-like n=1 Tax=Styela clava TaxID=7725 RepID=UPI00193A0806|nr:sodium-coupled monocarboxylate transporter 1-like [Styela clava]